MRLRGQSKAPARSITSIFLYLSQASFYTHETPNLFHFHRPKDAPCGAVVARSHLSVYAQAT